MIKALTKVAFVMPAVQEGGLEISMLRIASFLQSKGHNVTIVTTEQPGEWFQKVIYSGVTATHIGGLNNLFPYAHIFRVGKFLRESGFEIIFIVFDRFSQSALGMLPDDVIVIPLLRNDHPDIYRLGLANSAKWNIAIGNSPKNFETAKRYVSNRPVELIPNGVKIPPSRQIESAKDWQGPLRLAFVGRLIHESKGVLLIPDIIKKCRDNGVELSLTLAGSGVDRDLFIQKSIESGVLDRICLIGMISHSEVIELLCSSHILLLTSFYEGLPNVILESQACGCIPVASRLTGSTDYLVKHNETGMLVDIGDIGGFADAIGELANDRQKSARMSVSAREFISEQFSVEMEGNRYKDIICSALDGKYPTLISRAKGVPIDLSLFPFEYVYMPYLKKLNRMVIGNLGRYLKCIYKSKNLLNLFVREYIANRVIAFTPSITIRRFFYSKILSIKMDRSVNIQMGCYIYDSNGELTLGKNTIVNRYCTLDRRGGLYIGSSVNISAEVAIYTAGHDPQSPSFKDYVKPVIIEDYVWLGTRSSIMPGVRIGKGAFVLPGAIVTRDVAPFKIVGGIPAKEVGERNNLLNYNPSWHPLFQ
jgi:glycosyltransferase involved in cell wall biosynthesis/acetyltransferase-like isoleucine patch superfamily enzyme